MGVHKLGHVEVKIDNHQLSEQFANQAWRQLPGGHAAAGASVGQALKLPEMTGATALKAPELPVLPADTKKPYVATLTRITQAGAARRDSIAAQIAPYIKDHGMAQFEAHLPNELRLKWVAHKQGAPNELGQAIAADGGVLPKSFDLARNVPLYGGVVSADAHLATLVDRLNQIKKAGYAGFGGTNGLDQLAAKVKMGKDGPQQNAKAAGYQFLENGPDNGVWQLKLKGDHGLAATVKSDELPGVDYAVVITGNALQKLYEAHLKNRVVKPDLGGVD